MNYKTIYTETFFRELEKIGSYIAEDNPVRAYSWMKEAEKRANSLEVFPLACPLARENDSHGREIRQLVFGKALNKYRVIYTVLEEQKQVAIITICHSAVSLIDIDKLDV